MKFSPTNAPFANSSDRKTADEDDEIFYGAILDSLDANFKMRGIFEDFGEHS